MSLTKKTRTHLEMEAIRLTGVVAIHAFDHKWKKVTKVIEEALIKAATTPDDEKKEA